MKLYCKLGNFAKLDEIILPKCSKSRFAKFPHLRYLFDK